MPLLKLLIALGLLAAVGAMGSAPAAAADTNMMNRVPTTEEIVEALSPQPKLRGIKRVEEGEAEPEPPAVNLTVNFDFNSTELQPDARQTLDNLANALKSSSLEVSRFMIEGHTDAVGPEAYNLTLSQRRARAVLGYLAESHEIEPARLETLGKGESDLLEPVEGPSEANRRVRIVNLGEG